MNKEPVSAETALTALCVWEEMLRINATEEDDELNTLWENEGICEMRVHALTIAKWVDEVFELVPEDDRYDFAFDWEFVPECVGHVTWNDTNIELLDAKEMAKLISSFLQKAE